MVKNMKGVTCSVDEEALTRELVFDLGNGENITLNESAIRAAGDAMESASTSIIDKIAKSSPGSVLFKYKEELHSLLRAHTQTCNNCSSYFATKKGMAQA